MSGLIKLSIGIAVGAAIVGSLLSSKAAPPEQIAGILSAKPASVSNTARPVSQPPVSAASGYGWLKLPADRGGQYHADVEIEGQRIPMMVDTGATLVSLSWETAQRLGIRPMPNEFTATANTANGPVKVAVVMVREIRLGTMSVHNVRALVSPREVQAMDLLGMSFLQQLKFEVADGSLMLRQ